MPHRWWRHSRRFNKYFPVCVANIKLAKTNKDKIYRDVKNKHNCKSHPFLFLCYSCPRLPSSVSPLSITDTPNIPLQSLTDNPGSFLSSSSPVCYS